ncbi:MAG: metallophosphatase [Bacteroidales bacterium]|nr:metallophosphatase [Bacteroidales bacterium]
MKNKIFPLIITFLVLWLGIFSLEAQKIQDEVVILHTNDTHSQIDPYKAGTEKEAGGMFRHISYVNAVRDKYETVFLFHAGDFSQGTPYYNLFHGYPEIQFLNEMKYDAATLGNHEFDDGLQSLADRIKTADFPVVCANYKFKNKDLKKLVKPYVIIERNGMRLGVFGLTCHLYHMSGWPNVTDTAIYQDPIVTAKKMTSKLKKKNCDLIICLSHLGIGPDHRMMYPEMCDSLLAEKVQEIDLIIGGHTHYATPQPSKIGRVRIVQNDKQGITIGEFILKRKEEGLSK